MFTTQNQRIGTLVDISKIPELCQRWKIKELAVFGSILRDDFNPDQSDIDLLVVFDDQAHWTLFDLVDIEDDFTNFFGKKADLVEKASIEESSNRFRKKEILESYQVIYAAS